MQALDDMTQRAWQLGNFAQRGGGARADEDVAPPEAIWHATIVGLDTLAAARALLLLSSCGIEATNADDCPFKLLKSAWQLGSVGVQESAAFWVQAAGCAAANLCRAADLGPSWLTTGWHKTGVVVLDRILANTIVVLGAVVGREAEPQEALAPGQRHKPEVAFLGGPEMVGPALRTAEAVLRLSAKRAPAVKMLRRAIDVAWQEDLVQDGRLVLLGDEHNAAQVVTRLLNTITFQMAKNPAGAAQHLPAARCLAATAIKLARGLGDMASAAAAGFSPEQLTFLCQSGLLGSLLASGSLLAADLGIGVSRSTNLAAYMRWVSTSLLALLSNQASLSSQATLWHLPAWPWPAQHAVLHANGAKHSVPPVRFVVVEGLGLRRDLPAALQICRVLVLLPVAFPQGSWLSAARPQPKAGRACKLATVPDGSLLVARQIGSGAGVGSP